MSSICFGILSLRYCVAEIVALLLDRGAPIKVKNALGWSPMSEAISYGDRQISMFSSLPTYKRGQKLGLGETKHT